MGYTSDSENDFFWCLKHGDDRPYLGDLVFNAFYKKGSVQFVYVLNRPEVFRMLAAMDVLSDRWLFTTRFRDLKAVDGDMLITNRSEYRPLITSDDIKAIECAFNLPKGLVKLADQELLKNEHQLDTKVPIWYFEFRKSALRKKESAARLAYLKGEKK